MNAAKGASWRGTAEGAVELATVVVVAGADVDVGAAEEVGPDVVEVAVDVPGLDVPGLGVSGRAVAADVELTLVVAVALAVVEGVAVLLVHATTASIAAAVSNPIGRM